MIDTAPLFQRWAPSLLIAAFLVRGAFYCLEQPVWEGFDEWAHYAFIEHVARHGRLPSRDDAVSDALGWAVELAPLSASAAAYSRSLVTHDQFWRLSREERLSRERELKSLRLSRPHGGGVVFRQYEAQQAPLYYLLLAPIFLAIRTFSFPAQVFVLRFSSVMIAAVGVFLIYKIALNLPVSHRAAIPVLLLVVSWPGLLLDVTRIGNDGLALTLGGAFLLSLFRVIRRPSTLPDWISTGIILGAALLTKTYMLAFVPLLAFVLLAERLRCRPALASTLKGMVVTCAVAAAISGWWYAGTYRATGTLSGEQVDASTARFGYTGKLIAARKMKWLRVLDSAAATHIWTGGWSFLNVRSWIYHTFECIAAIAATGLVFLLVRLGIRRRRKLTPGNACFLVTVIAFAFFCSGLAYSAVTRYLTQGIYSALGWYLYAAGGIEFVLLGGGFTGLAGMRRSGGSVAGVAALACVLDVYTVHFVSVPYYIGVVAHVQSGAMAAFHPASAMRNIGVHEIIARFAVNKPASAAVLVVLWAAYLCVTIGLLAWSGVLFVRTWFIKRGGSGDWLVIKQQA